ncbi:MAG TPA: neutral zinc metallopeptidase [Pilimelia sp.]|nr:neutral zinc metallopeptidase [Pilimelia sp.]
MAVALAAVSLLGAGCALPVRRDAAPSAASGGLRSGDGTASVAEFRQDVQDAQGSVEGYWRQTLPRQGVPFRPVSQVRPYTGAQEVACAGTALGLNNAAYCPAGDFIAYDANWAVGQFRRIGDAFIFYLVGHEYAHAVQQRLRVSHRFTIQHELQADCLAGAYIGQSVRGGSLQLQDGDLAELRRGLLAVADDPSQPWFAPDAHGTVEQRTRSFFDGFERGLAACDLTVGG